MPTTLSEFHTLVRDAIGRSTELDTAIALRTKLAARWLERNYTFQYMRDWRVLSLSASATYPYIISLAGLEVKRVELLRSRSADDAGTGYKFSRPLKQLKPGDRETRSAGVPESFYLNGVSSLVLNSIPEEDMTFEGHFQLYTQWGSADGWTHWLLENATQLLLSRTLLMMTMGRTRDGALYDMYKSEFDLEIESFKVAEEELQTGEVIAIWEPPEGASNDEFLRSQ